MKSCLIVTGGSLDRDFAAGFLKGRVYDYVVAVDRGADTLYALGMTPHEIVGDLDSASPAAIAAYRNNPAVHMEIHKAEKDETDTELALMAAVRNGCGQADMLGALGGRMDHAIANIHLLYEYFKQGLKVCIYDERNKLYLLNQAARFDRSKLYGTYISFLPLTEEIKGLTLIGFKYPLKNREILLGTSLCISNELAEDEGLMELQSGVLICVEARD